MPKSIWLSSRWTECYPRSYGLFTQQLFKRPFSHDALHVFPLVQTSGLVRCHRIYTFELSTVSTRQIASSNFYSFILYFYLHGFFFCFICYRILFSKIALFFLFTSFDLKQSNCQRSTPGTIKPMYRPFWEFKAIIAKQLVFFRFFNNKFRQV